MTGDPVYPDEPQCEWYGSRTTWRGGMPRTERGDYCLKPAADDWPPR